MNRILLPALVSLLAMGCGKAAVRTQALAPEKPAPVVTEQKETVAKAEPEAAEEEQAPVEGRREVGDYVVYRFSGSFQKAPVTLTERVVGRDKNSLLIDFLLEEGKEKSELRVRLSDTAETRGEVLSVQRIEKGKLVAAGVDEYEALMGKTMVVADENEEALGSEHVVAVMGNDMLPAKRTSFRVKIGEKKATLTTVVSDKFPWGDLSGEIAAEDGSVIYRAEVLNVGHVVESKTGKEPQVARSDYEDE
ncbi:hypothetical protein [Polyangium fumosum]|uniref:DUF5666 domain-containing protein n=1 Tax=Polyangium fumosum TaxID=889272 RepID=A0A4V5PPN6_9BACT|nr:hypothetical protein [Polyangium fumosum]TKD06586.1 hypothetical protein E8A74_18945 [Polyangium fumosum]